MAAEAAHEPDLCQRVYPASPELLGLAVRPAARSGRCTRQPAGLRRRLACCSWSASTLPRAVAPPRRRRPERFPELCRMVVETVDSQVKDSFHVKNTLIAPLAITIFCLILLMNSIDLLPVDVVSVFASFDRRARRAASGYGFVPKGSHSLCRCTRARIVAGSKPATPPSTTFSQIPPMPAPTLMANHVGRRCWMHRASAESGSENCLAPSGRCSFRTIIQASSIGGPMRPTRIASPRIPAPDRTKRAAP